MTKSIIFARPTSLSAGINLSLVFLIVHFLSIFSRCRTPRKRELSLFHLPTASHTVEYRGERPPCLLVSSFARASVSKVFRRLAPSGGPRRPVQRGAEESRSEKSLSQNGCPYLRDSGAEAFSELPPPTVNPPPPPPPPSPPPPPPRLDG